MKILLFFFLLSTYAYEILEGIYKYDISWENLKAGEAVIQIEKQGSDYVLRVSGKTANWLRPFYYLSYKAEVLMKKDFSLVKGTAIKNDKKEDEVIVYTRYNDSLKIERTVFKKKFKKETSHIKELNAAWDPFSSAIAALLENWSFGKKSRYFVSNGKTEYEINLEVINEKPVSTSEKIVTLKPIIKSQNTKQIKKLKQVTIKLKSENGFNFVDEIRSKVFIGSVYFKLKSIDPIKTSFI
ncbi:MAG: DUF3108 domain-containing protein [Deltaproteobacteria bacterium]|nr:DUF3108 domain-containing protein [Deltaproteobacteria bacterium]